MKRQLLADSMDLNLSKFQDRGKDREPGILHSIGSQRAGHDLVTEQQQQAINCCSAAF